MLDYVAAVGLFLAVLCLTIGRIMIKYYCLTQLKASKYINRAYQRGLQFLCSLRIYDIAST